MAFGNITKREFGISEREPTANQYGVYGIDIDVIGKVENAITIWTEEKYPNNEEQENAEFIAYCFNLQQKLDISCYEEVVEYVENLMNRVKQCGNFTEFDYQELKVLLTKAKRQ